MGYSEITCNICNVSFNVHRIRRGSEPPAAALGGPMAVNGMYHCTSEEHGCCVFPRGRTNAGASTWIMEFLKWLTSDYEIRSMIETTSGVSVDEWIEVSTSEMLQHFQRITNGGDIVTQEEPIGETTDEDDDNEHIAGPSCIHVGGYNGHDISADDMRFSLTWQALVRKVSGCPYSYYAEGTKDFELEDDDEDFEKEGPIFLSGLSDHMHSRDFPETRGMTPVRHGIAYEPSPENQLDLIPGHEDIREFSMPFHPYCLEIYKRASIARQGSADMTALMDWWTIEHTYEDWESFPVHPDVRKSRLQWWMHHSATEYLAAYPLSTPALDDVLRATINREKGFDIQQGSFNVPEPQLLRTNPTDPFATLPPEVRHRILFELDPLSIAHLRLSSRCCRQIPLLVFRKLLMDRYPHLWEMIPELSEMPYSKWSTNTQTSLQIALSKARKMQISETSRSIEQEIELTCMAFMDTQSDETLRGLFLNKTKNKKHFSKKIQSWWKKHQGDPPPSSQAPRDGLGELPTSSCVKLEQRSTDWYMLYSLLNTREERLLGLKNRERIWKDCLQILDRIQAYKNEGRIPLELDPRQIVRLREDTDAVGT